jgi:hypothetical protein
MALRIRTLTTAIYVLSLGPKQPPTEKLAVTNGS